MRKDEIDGFAAIEKPSHKVTLGAKLATVGRRSLGAGKHIVELALKKESK